jgi:23S rRNA (uridine2552-2'-O)-methyltransferase
MPINFLKPINPRQHNPVARRKKITHHFEVKDFYYWEAKRNGFRARSAFKLLEIQEKFKLIQPGMNVLDIGAAPGSFLQVIHSVIKDTGKIVGVDIQKIEPLGYENLSLFQHDVFETETLLEKIRSVGIGKFDLMTSDIAPATSGMPGGVDQYRSIELNLAIVNVADVYLKKG